MIAADMLKMVKQIEIRTKRALSGALVGDYGSALKGFGFEFDQIREYQLGDDIRFIDWKSSAKTNKILVKQYLEERNRTILLFVDISSSLFWGSQGKSKYEIIAQIAGVLSIASVYGKDKIGLIFFSDLIEKKIKPNKGMKNVYNLIKEIFSFKSSKNKTDLNIPFEFLAKNKSKDIVAFVISDFLGELDEKLLRFSLKKHDVILIRCLDPNEIRLPTNAMILAEDIESGKQKSFWSSKFSDKEIDKKLYSRLRLQNLFFKKCGVDFFQIVSNQPFIKGLIVFFRKRMLYSSM